MRHVFVYGTLRAGEANDIGHAAARHGIPAPTLLGAVALPGELYDFGTYPGMVAGAAGQSLVWGDVYAVDDCCCPCSTRSNASIPASTRCSGRNR